jgi:hypothetical protein
VTRTTPFRAPKPAALLLCAVLCAGGAGGASAAPNGPIASAAPAAGLDGLWEGLMVFRPAEVEIEFAVEIARAADGRLVGTIDVPNQQLLFHPLDRVALDGRKGEFAFTWFVPHAQQNVSTTFTGALTGDGKSFAGTLVESDAPETSIPFSMKRLGDPGTPRKETKQGTLLPLSPAAPVELKEAFNRDAGKTRLVMLLSPT